jgi:hypothetical protein
MPITIRIHGPLVCPGKRRPHMSRTTSVRPCKPGYKRQGILQLPPLPRGRPLADHVVSVLFWRLECEQGAISTRQPDHRDPSNLDSIFIKYRRLIQPDIFEMLVLALQHLVVHAFRYIDDWSARDSDGVLMGVWVRTQKSNGHVKVHRECRVGRGCDGRISVRERRALG